MICKRLKRKNSNPQQKTLNAEAKSLEKSGKLVEAKLKSAESLGYIDQKEASQEISRLDQKLKNDVRSAIALWQGACGRALQMLVFTRHPSGFIAQTRC